MAEFLDFTGAKERKKPEEKASYKPEIIDLTAKKIKKNYEDREALIRKLENAKGGDELIQTNEQGDTKGVLNDPIKNSQVEELIEDGLEGDFDDETASTEEITDARNRGKMNAHDSTVMMAKPSLEKTSKFFEGVRKGAGVPKDIAGIDKDTFKKNEKGAGENILLPEQKWKAIVDNRNEKIKRNYDELGWDESQAVKTIVEKFFEPSALKEMADILKEKSFEVMNALKLGKEIKIGDDFVLEPVFDMQKAERIFGKKVIIDILEKGAEELSGYVREAQVEEKMSSLFSVVKNGAKEAKLSRLIQGNFPEITERSKFFKSPQEAQAFLEKELDSKEKESVYKLLPAVYYLDSKNMPFGPAPLGIIGRLKAYFKIVPDEETFKENIVRQKIEKIRDEIEFAREKFLKGEK